jgi:electron transfer flavoprotein alpha subunit
MSVLVYAELDSGRFKKATLEACSYGVALASMRNSDVAAIVIGECHESELFQIVECGISKVFRVLDSHLETFTTSKYISVIQKIVRENGFNTLITSQSYNSKAITPGLSIRLKSAFISGVIGLPRIEGGKEIYQRMAYSGKGIEEVSALLSDIVLSVKTNSFGVNKNKTGELNVIPFNFSLSDDVNDILPKEIIKTSSTISLTDAEKVVSGGRGLKGPENWGMIEELAGLLGAATACSKPVADVEWRPHHEHVGQTGIQISPDLYIAIGISGAIQHLAGVNSSKVIVVINKDSEAPFFKSADYGIVGDAFEVVPKLINAVKKMKNSL